MQNACPSRLERQRVSGSPQFSTALPCRGAILTCMRFPILIRVVIVAAVGLGLLVPLALIQGKVTERQTRADAVQRAFAEEMSGPQVLAGPLLALTCEETYTDERTVYQQGGQPLTVREKKQRPCPTELYLPREL